MPIQLYRLFYAFLRASYSFSRSNYKYSCFFSRTNLSIASIPFTISNVDSFDNR